MSTQTLPERTMTVAARRRAERVEDAAFMAATGESLDGAAARLGIGPAALERALYRAGRADVVQQLRRNLDCRGGAVRRGRVSGRAA